MANAIVAEQYLIIIPSTNEAAFYQERFKFQKFNFAITLSILKVWKCSFNSEKFLALLSKSRFRAA